MCVKVLDDIADDFSNIIENWYYENTTSPSIQANNINETLELLFDTYPGKKAVFSKENMISI